MLQTFAASHLLNTKPLKQSRSTVVVNPGRDISFPIFTRKEVETKRIGKESKTIISRLNDLSSFLSNIEQNRN